MNLPLPVAIIGVIAIVGLGGAVRVFGRKSRAVSDVPLLDGCSRLHEFKDSAGAIVGVLYGRARAPGIYSRLLIVDDSRQPPAPLYEFATREFRIELLRPDHIVVRYPQQGDIAADALTVKWCADTRRFSVVTPG